MELHKIYTGSKLNAFGKTFYKFINKGKPHHGFIFKEGLNIDTIPFNPVGNCSQSGLYFTTVDHIFKYTRFGSNFCKIIIPGDATCCVEVDKIKADKIIVASFDHQLSLEVSASAIKHNGMAIKYAIKQTPELCMFAVE